MSTGTEDLITPRPIFCIIQHVHSEREVAENACSGRFTHAGITLDLGTEPDWLGADLPADEEWRIEWNKFYYGLDLANAFLEGGDIRFLRTWELLVRSWIRQATPFIDPSDVAARRMQNWTYAWSLFAAAPDFPGLAEGLASEILGSLAEHAGYVRNELTPDVYRNHRTLELYSLFIVALAWPQIDRSSELLSSTISELDRTLREGFRADGVHREGSSHYHMVVLRSLLGARENARRFALDLPDGFDDRLERACEFALHCHRPDGLIPALSDGDSATYPEVLELGSSLLRRGDFRYAATGGSDGPRPDARNVNFAESGYFVQRSDWGTGPADFRDARFLIFDCGPLGDGGHGHYDLLNLEAYAYGRSLVVDPGRYTYSEEAPNLRHWFKGTAAHNTVCIDGMDQTPYRRGRPGKEIATGRFIGRLSVPGFDILEGEATSPCYDAIHRRRVVFIDDEYWIVEDLLEAGRPHLYDLRWHLSSEAWDSTELSVAERNSTVVAPGLALVLAGDGEARLERGWVSPVYGHKAPAPVVSLSTRSARARFLTLIAPLRPHQPAPRLVVLATGEGRSGVTVVAIEGVAESGARDLVAWSGDPAPMNLGGVECTASAAWARESAQGEPISFCSVDATVGRPAEIGLERSPDGNENGTGP